MDSFSSISISHCRKFETSSRDSVFFGFYCITSKIVYQKSNFFRASVVESSYLDFYWSS